MIGMKSWTICSCKEFQNLNAFFALVMGLSNVAVSRLTQTWERLPSKLRKMFTEFDSLIEPSRNHRAYRIAVGKLQPPIIPFMPLLLKGTPLLSKPPMLFQFRTIVVDVSSAKLLNRTIDTRSSNWFNIKLRENHSKKKNSKKQRNLKALFFHFSCDQLTVNRNPQKTEHGEKSKLWNFVTLFFLLRSVKIFYSLFHISSCKFVQVEWVTVQ